MRVRMRIFERDFLHVFTDVLLEKQRTATAKLVVRIYCNFITYHVNSDSENLAFRLLLFT